MKAAKLSLTIPHYLPAMLDLVLTPVGCFSPPKGTMSALVSNLLQKYLEDYFKTDILSLIEYLENNPNSSLEELTQYFADKQLLEQAEDLDLV